MTYFPDLSPCTYFGKEHADKLVAIGWLDEAQPYAKGNVGEAFLGRLIELLVKPWAPVVFLGFHECSWCDEEVGLNNLFVPSAGFLYAMPALAAHYIQAHGYAPPAEFQDAVLSCPPMRSREYFEAIIANAPLRFADSVRKHHLSA